MLSFSCLFRSPVSVVYLLLTTSLAFSPATQAQVADSLMKELARSKVDTHRVSLLYQISYANWIDGDDSLANLYALRSAAIARKTDFVKGEARARLFIARIEVDRLLYFDAAMAQVDTVLQLASKHNDPHLEGEAYIRRAQLLDTRVNRQKEIPVLYDKALAIFRKLGDKSWQGTVYNELAQIKLRAGISDEGVKFLLEARKLQEEAKDFKALRSTMPNLGVAYSSLGMYNEALEAFDAVAKLPATRNDKILQLFVQRQRADIFEKQGKFSEALAILTKIIADQEAIGPAYWLPKAYAKLGRIYYELKDDENALKYTQLADKLSMEAAGTEEFLDHFVQINYGKIYLRRKAYDKVISYATRGLEWASTSEPVLLLEMAEYNFQLADAYQATGRYQLALSHFRSYKAESDSLSNRELVQKATATSLNYDFDKKEQLNKLHIEELENAKLVQARNFLIGLSVLVMLIAAIVIWSNRKLQNKNAELEAKNQEISGALQKGKHIERKRVASELHDNLNTKLAALRWRMEALDVSAYGAQDRKIHAGSLEMLEDIYADVRLISHDMLPAELKTQGLASALKKLTDQLNTNPKIQFRLVADTTMRVDEKVEFEIYQVALELVNNIIKHAQASEVELHLSENNGLLRLTVSDNGIGFNSELLSKGIGLNSIGSRIDSIQGSWKVESSPANGTRIVAEVPLS